MLTAMKVFLDTNIFLDYFQRRQQYHAVSQIFDAIEDGKLKAVVSTGCIYTLAYVIRIELKRMGVFRPEQTERLRSTLNTILGLVSTANLSHRNAINGINDTAFDDVEDSFQYQCAKQSKCDVLLTINLRDYRNADASKIEILSPIDFVEKYLL